MGMVMNHWEQEGLRLKKTFPLISTFKQQLQDRLIMRDGDNNDKQKNYEKACSGNVVRKKHAYACVSEGAHT